MGIGRLLGRARRLVGELVLAGRSLVPVSMPALELRRPCHDRTGAALGGFRPGAGAAAMGESAVVSRRLGNDAEPVAV